MPCDGPLSMVRDGLSRYALISLTSLAGVIHFNFTEFISNFIESTRKQEGYPTTREDSNIFRCERFTSLESIPFLWNNALTSEPSTEPRENGTQEIT